jgi:hypothetical protein
MVSRRDWYARVNAAWTAARPANAPLPTLTGPEAVRAARRLFRFETRTTWTRPVRVTSGNRYTYAHGGVLHVNPDRGWSEFVHELSHWLHNRAGARSQFGPHHPSHARLELRLVNQVVRRGWLDGRLRDKERPAELASRFTPPDDRVERRAAQVRRLETKLKSLATRLRTARRSLAALQRAAARRAAGGAA